jgi:hypothetical protein
VREVRPDTPTYTDWGGGSSEAAEQYGKKCLARADRTFSQGLQCQQINSVMALLSTETWQTTDYGKYEMTMFDEGERKKRRETIFPQERKNAFDLGTELTIK